MIRKLEQLSRKEQMWWLISLSALTAVAQYVVQGALASGHSPADFYPVFWYVDFALWGLRAIIEAWAIVYLFSTVAHTQWQNALLIVFEVALIALITLTLGPALRALGLGLQMRDSLQGGWFTAWNFGIAAYVSLMMAATGTAYKIQPVDSDATPDGAAQAQIAELQGRVAEMQATLKIVQHFSQLDPRLQVRWIMQNRNGKPGNSELARIYEVDPATIGRWGKVNDG
jgi:hypothetical protein